MDIPFKEYITSPNPVILDIGTYNGDDAVNFLQLFPTATVYAFEADPLVWDIFEKSVSSKIEYPSSRLELVKHAVGNTNGKLTFHNSYFNLDTPGESGDFKKPGASGTFQKPTAHFRYHPEVFYGTTEVDCVTLDSWFESKDIDIIDFAWTDVNGAEIALIEGGFNTFTKRTRYLLLECISYELWENQSTKEVVLQMLPDFTLIMEDAHNILLKNNKLI